MKFLITRLYILLAIVVSALSITSCDKMDDNGVFYGYWLLTDAAGPEGSLETAPEQGTPSVNTEVIDFNMSRTITWGVRNELIVVHEIGKLDYYFFTFTRDELTLQLREAFYNDGSNDTKIELSEIPAHFYIPADGLYRIINLDGDGMALKYGDVTLTFKSN